MQFRRQRQKGSIGLDMTPIIDTVFNLLIFFALSFNFGVNPGIQVKLPKASAEAVKKEKREVSVTITKDGEIMLDGSPITIDNLSWRFKTLCYENPDAMIIIFADRKTFHEKVVEVMDAAKSVGLSKLAIATTPKE